MKRYLMASLLLSALLLAACSARPAPKPITGLDIMDQHSGVPVQYVQFDKPVAYWTDTTKTSITLLTYGSSSCPNVPTDFQVQDATRATLPLKQYPGACTADYGPYTTVMLAPTAISHTQSVVLTLTGGLGTNDLVLTLSPDMQTFPVATPEPQPGTSTAGS